MSNDGIQHNLVDNLHGMDKLNLLNINRKYCLLLKYVLTALSEKLDVQKWLHPKTADFFQKFFFHFLFVKTKKKQTNKKLL